MADQVRILILDPDDQSAAECIQAFEGRGWQADRARTFEEGEVLLAKESYDVAIIDLILPDLDGTEAWSRIRAESRDTLGIITTSSTSLHSSVYAADRGVVAYLQKPLRMPALCSFIDESLRFQRGAHKENGTQRQLVGLCQLLSSISHTADATQVLKNTLAHLPAIHKFDLAAIYLLNEDKTSWTRLVQHRLFPLQFELTDAQSEFIQKSAIEIIHSPQPLAPFQPEDSDRRGYRLQLQKVGFSDLLVVPILGPAEPYGALAVIGVLDSDLTFSAYDFHLLTIVSQALALALDRVHIIKQLGAGPIHDEATGAYTAAYLDALIGIEAARWRRNAQPFCLVLMDTPVLGQRSEDERAEVRLSLQQDVASAAHLSVRRSDVVARLPDWQVAILLPETAQSGAQQAITRLTKVIESRLAERSGMAIPPIKTHLVMPTQNAQSLGDLLGLAQA